MPLRRRFLGYASFSPAQQAALNATLPTNATGAELIARVKGTANAKFRTRTRLLGDIVNSSLGIALPSQKTASDLTGDTTYTTYLATKANSMTPAFWPMPMTAFSTSSIPVMVQDDMHTCHPLR